MNIAKITVEATVAATRERVWDCYTNPYHITKWNFASDNWHCPNAKNDLRVGGKYMARMESKDGKWGFDFEAYYLTLNPKESFTYEMTDGRKASVTFTDLGGSTEVTVDFDPENQNPVELQREGWQAILNNFKRYTEHQD